MRLLFKISVKVAKPILVGLDAVNGRRQLIPIVSGFLRGTDMDGVPISGTLLEGGIDSQVIRPDGKCEVSARYAVRLNDGRSFYIENNGIRTVPEAYVHQVLNGEFIDPSLYYFVTCPKFEAFDDSLRWLESYVFFCKGTRTPDDVVIDYYVID